MQAQLAVLDPLPLFRQGALAALGRGGSDLAGRQELLTWLSEVSHGLLLLTLADEPSWVSLAELGGRTEVDVIALLGEFNVATSARALRLGAVNVLPRDASPPTVRLAVEQTLSGGVTLSLHTLKAAMSKPKESGQSIAPTDAEIDWLRALASGITVPTLAASVGYSERMMYRKLAQLYARLDVRTKTQALLVAQGEGWV